MHMLNTEASQEVTHNKMLYDAFIADLKEGDTIPVDKVLHALKFSQTEYDRTRMVQAVWRWNKSLRRLYGLELISRKNEDSLRIVEYIVANDHQKHSKSLLHAKKARRQNRTSLKIAEITDPLKLTESERVLFNRNRAQMQNALWLERQDQQRETISNRVRNLASSSSTYNNKSDISGIFDPLTRK